MMLLKLESALESPRELAIIQCIRPSQLQGSDSVGLGQGPGDTEATGSESLSENHAQMYYSAVYWDPATLKGFFSRAATVSDSRTSAGFVEACFTGPAISGHKLWGRRRQEHPSLKPRFLKQWFFTERQANSSPAEPCEKPISPSRKI